MRIIYSSCRNREGKDGAHVSAGTSSQQGRKIYMRMEKNTVQKTEELEREGRTGMAQETVWEMHGAS